MSPVSRDTSSPSEASSYDAPPETPDIVEPLGILGACASSPPAVYGVVISALPRPSIGQRPVIERRRRWLDRRLAGQSISGVRRIGGLRTRCRPPCQRPVKALLPRPRTGRHVHPRHACRGGPVVRRRIRVRQSARTGTGVLHAAGGTG